MFGKLFGDVLGVAGDVAKIAIAPVAIAATTVRAVTKPLSDTISEVAKDISNELKDDNKP